MCANYIVGILWTLLWLGIEGWLAAQEIRELRQMPAGWAIVQSGYIGGYLPILTKAPHAGRQRDWGFLAGHCAIMFLGSAISLAWIVGLPWLIILANSC